MSRYFLKSIEIEGFRGINNEGEPLMIAFDSSKVNSLFAPNGYGKSSIYEALSYAIRGSVQRLDELQASERPNDYYANRFHGSGKATISLEFESDDLPSQVVQILVERSPSGRRTVTSPSSHLDPEGFLASLDQPFTLLDYRSFSQFIDESPLNRGRSFAALLGMNDYSLFAQALQYVANPKVIDSDLGLSSTKSKIEGLEKGVQSALSRARSSYELLTGVPLVDTSDFAANAREVSSVLQGVPILEPHFREATLDSVDLDLVVASLRAAEHSDERDQLSKLIQRIEGLEAIGEPEAAQADTISSERKDIDAKIREVGELYLTTRGSECRHFYVEASTFLDSGAWENELKCPLCDSGLSEPISQIVSRQVALYEAVDSKIAEIQALWNGSLLASRLAVLESEAVVLSDRSALSPTLTAKSMTGSFTSIELERASEQIAALEESRSMMLLNDRAAKITLETALPASLVKLTEQVEAARTFVTAMSEIEISTQLVAKLKDRLTLRRRWAKVISKVHDSFAQSVSVAAASKVTDIDSAFKEMFKALMMGGDVIPDLRRESGESLNVMLQDFHGLSDLSAKALLSESQRNALAISVFLTAAMNHSSSSRFVVLDDVTSSFDAGHQLFLMEFIRTRMQHGPTSDGIQFLILSHDGQLEKYFDRITETHQWTHHKLLGLAPVGKIFLDRQDGQRLRDSVSGFLDAGQIDQAQPLMRQYLEFKLMQIIRSVKIPVPLDFAMRDQTRMVSNCLSAIDNAVELTSRAGLLVLTGTQVSDLLSIHVPAIVGNWTAHYETASTSSLSPAVLKGVLQAVDEYSECFKYDEVGSGGTAVRKFYKSLTSR